MTSSRPSTPEPPGPPRSGITASTDPPPGYPIEPLITVEIETFATTAPKVRVKVLDNDANKAMDVALDTYEQVLANSSEIWFEQRQANARHEKTPASPDAKASAD